ncbi:MAG TPA: enoyl-CoA hydratase/isomerase family protein [Limnochordales bacterium]
MEWPSYKRLQVWQEESVVLVRINRPEAANALDRATATELRDAVERARDAEDVRAMVLTGAGDRVFCAGADLKERREWKGREYEARRPLVELWQALYAFPKPLVMAVNGHAAGGGFEILFLADAVLATENAQFWLPEVQWGGIPGGWATQVLPRFLGPIRARWLILSGERLSAQEARACHIVTEIVPAGQLLARALTVARLLAELPPTAVAVAKEAVRHALSTPLAAGVDVEDRLLQIATAAPERETYLAKFFGPRSGREKADPAQRQS